MSAAFDARSPYADLDRPPLRAAALRRALVRPGGLISELEVVSATGSTNADVAERAAADADEGVLYVAEYQHAGRGRLERSWTVPERSGLMFSVLLRPTHVPLRRWTWLPLLVGCAIQHTLVEVAEVPATLKWPNDVLIDGHKVCGVLLQRCDSARGPAAVVGVGLNVSMSATELPTADATSLAIAGAACTDRDPLLRALVRNLDTLYQAWQAAAGDPEAGLRAAYIGRCSTVGREVCIHTDAEQSHEGIAVDIDADGRLVVDHGGATTAYGAGDVTHVR